MSADNAIAILKTTDKFKVENPYTLVNTFGEGITAYRVAEIQAIDNFEYFKENELHNLGAWILTCFSRENVVYSHLEARKKAEKLCNAVGYVEYGIVELDASEYNFPGC